MDFRLEFFIYNFLLFASSIGMGQRKGSCPVPAERSKTPIDNKKVSDLSIIVYLKNA